MTVATEALPPSPQLAPVPDEVWSDRDTVLADTNARELVERMQVTGLSPRLADYAVWPIRILVLLPALDFLLSLQRSKWISARRPGVVTIATTLEGTGLALTLVSTVGGLNMTGAVAGAIAMIAGRLSANGYLWWRGSRGGLDGLETGADPER